jgi:hypothetical protein
MPNCKLIAMALFVSASASATSINFDYPDFAVTTCVFFDPMTDRLTKQSESALSNFLESSFSGGKALDPSPYGNGYVEIEIVEFEQKDQNARQLDMQASTNIARIRVITDHLLKYHPELSSISVSGRLARNGGTDIAWSLCPPHDGFFLKVRLPTGPAKAMCHGRRGCAVKCLPEVCIPVGVEPLK